MLDITERMKRPAQSLNHIGSNELVMSKESRGSEGEGMNIEKVDARECNESEGKVRMDVHLRDERIVLPAGFQKHQGTSNDLLSGPVL